MNCARRPWLACFLLLVGLGATHAGEAPVTWDLSEIYAGDDAWESARQVVAGSAGELDRFKGELGSSAAVLKAALDASFAIRMQVSRLAAYAGMRADVDMTTPEPMRAAMRLMNEVMDQIDGILDK